MVGSGSVPMDERTCLLGQCTTEERLACRHRLRRYAAMQQNDMDAPQDEEAQDSAAALREEYQSTHHLLLLLLLTVSMFVVSPLRALLLVLFLRCSRIVLRCLAQSIGEAAGPLWPFNAPEFSASMAPCGPVLCLCFLPELGQNCRACPGVLGLSQMGSRLSVTDQGNIGGHAVGSGQSVGRRW